MAQFMRNTAKGKTLGLRTVDVAQDHPEQFRDYAKVLRRHQSAAGTAKNTWDDVVALKREKKRGNNYRLQLKKAIAKHNVAKRRKNITYREMVSERQPLVDALVEGGDQRLDPQASIEAGAKWLGMLLRKHGDERKAVAAYRMGNLKGPKGSPWEDTLERYSGKTKAALEKRISDVEGYKKQYPVMKGVRPGVYPLPTQVKTRVVPGVTSHDFSDGHLIVVPRGPKAQGHLAPSQESRLVLKHGMRGNDVRALQQRLGIKADGIYGRQTASVVRDYQRRNGLAVDGIAGRQTFNHLHHGAARATYAPESGLESRTLLKRGMRGNDVRALQQRLGIKADGIYGHQTASAVRDYQRRNGLAIDGIAGRQTFNHLLQSNPLRFAAKGLQPKPGLS